MVTSKSLYSQHNVSAITCSILNNQIEIKTSASNRQE